MATSSINSFVNSYGIKNTGIGGLASGLNTDEIVEALVYSTRSKIQKQQQQKQVLQWQQAAYRNVNSALTSFQDKFLTTGAAMDIRSTSFWNTYKGVSSSDKVALVSSSTTKTGTVTIEEIRQLATAQTITVDISNRGFTPDLTSTKEVDITDNFAGKTLTIQVDSMTARTVRLDDLNNVSARNTAGYYTSGATAAEYAYILNDMSLTAPLNDEQAFAVELQYLIDQAVGTKSNSTNTDKTSLINVSTIAGSAFGSIYINIDSPTSNATIMAGCEILGFDEDQSIKLNTARSVADVFGLSGDSFTFSINGTEFNILATESVATLMTRINDSMSPVRMEYSPRTNSFIITSKVSGAGDNIAIQDISGNLMNTLIGAPGSYTLTSSEIEDWDLGYTNEIVADSAALSTLLGNPTFLDADAWTDWLEAMSLSGNSFSITVEIGGQQYTLLIDDIPDMVTSSSGRKTFGSQTATNWIANALNKALKEEMGDDYDENTCKFNFNYDKDTEEYTLAVTTSKYEEIKLLAGAGSANVNLESLFVTTNNRSSTPTLLADLFADRDATFDGVFYIKAEDGSIQAVNWGPSSGPPPVTTLSELISALNDTFYNVTTAPNDPEDRFFSFVDGRLYAGDGVNELYLSEHNDPTDPTYDGGALLALFGLNHYDGTSRAIPGVKNTLGKNAEIVIYEADGSLSVVPSSTNVFDIDGIVFEVSNEHTGGPTDRITITSKSDPDELVDKLMTFIDDYNAIIESLNLIIYESKESGYDPLTDEQKAEMTEQQIKDWENEAKKGILRSDPTLRAIIDGMRSITTLIVESAGVTLYDVGIRTASYIDSSSNASYELSKSGVLTVDESILRQAIEQNPDGLRNLFTYRSPEYVKGDITAPVGVAFTIYNKIQDAISKIPTDDGSARGSLIRVAGSDSMAAGNYELGRKITRIDEYIATLQSRLEKEYNRHWSKFTALETAIQRMNTQAGWLADFGS